MHIRRATLDDSPLLSSLCMDVQRLHAENHPEIFKMPQREDFAVSFFDEILADPTASSYIAEEEQRAIGYIFCKLFERPESVFTYPNRFLQIEHISVRPEAQGHGVGAALIQRAAKLAGEIGVTKIQLSSWDFNTRAHTFFEKHGFAKIEYRFWSYLK
ncbi:MAG TPA: GNAT family N-acetyltransferase [Anaerolineales bacterium]|nr:GNAT family N-acetyltransferase [Anaerolineales bacterium]